MANQINVFELTNTTLNSLTEGKKSTAKKSAKKLSESKVTAKRSKRVAGRAMKKESIAKISCKKLRLESIRFAESAESDEFDFTPEDEVVVVVDPVMDEVPASEEEAQAAAEELVGDTVCKCSVCGTNYVCECDSTIQEDVDGEIETCVEDGSCPICGEEAPQIVVGEIVPADNTVEPDEVDDNNEVDVDKVDIADDDEVIDDEANESVRKPARKRPVRRESTARRTTRKPIARTRRESVVRDTARSAIRRTVRKPALRNERVAASTRTARPVRTARKPIRTENRMPARCTSAIAKRPVARKTVNFNEAALNRLFTKFAKENYSDIASVRFTNGKVVGSKLTVEGVVRTVTGSKRTIKLVAEGFKPMSGKTLKLRCREIGPFTESATVGKNRVPFVVECAVRAGTVTPVSMKYAYVTKNGGLKESRGKSAKYSVTGIVK